MALADEVFAQSTTSPWTQAVQALQTADETPDHEQSRVDLEVVTGNYRSGGLSTKARAGFRMYASAADQVRLRRAMTDPEIMQEIFSL